LKSRLRLITLAAATVSLPAFSAAQTVDNWIAGSSDWNNPANWSLNTAPAANVNVNIVDSDGVSRTINYDYSGSAISLGALSLNLTGGTGTTSAIFSMSGNTLTAQVENIGGYIGSPNGGNATFNLTGGVNTIDETSLYLGYGADDQGFYNLSGGALEVNQYEYVGYNGIGYLNQIGGINSIGFGGLCLGCNAGSMGTVALGGTGSLVVGANRSEIVGESGTGVFNQTGGSNAINADRNDNACIYLGYNSGSTGTYILSGTGSLSVGGQGNGIEEVGNLGTGVFDQIGGANNCQTLTLGVSNGSAGSYAQTGGTNTCQYLTVGRSAGSAGNYTQTGGITTCVDFTLASVNGSTGTYTLSGNGALVVNARGGTEYVGYGGTGVFNQSGGTNATRACLMNRFWL
jgi:hypothetical protein